MKEIQTRKALNYLLLVLGVVIGMASCKTMQQPSVTTNTSGQDSTAFIEVIPDDSVYLITQAGDTLSSLDEEVVIDLQKISPSSINVVGVGDMMLGTNFPSKNYLPPSDGKYLLDPVKDSLLNADLTFGNLEGVILNEGGHPKSCKDPSVCYLFRSPEHYVSYLKDAGFDVVSTANNHAGDFGNPGRKNTMRVLDSLGIAHAGLEKVPYTLIRKKEATYGFAAFSPNTGTMSINDLDEAIRITKLLDSLSDIVIISFHGGAEGSKYQHVPRKREIFYGENRGDVYNFAHELINYGADIVFGHGPHVTRAIEVYKDRFIAYSLGNFATYARFNLRGPNGIAPLIRVNVSSDGTFNYAYITATKQEGEGGPVIDEEKQVVTKLQNLTKEDFPETKIIIEDSGLIRKAD